MEMSSSIFIKLILFRLFHSTNAIFCSKTAAEAQFKYFVELIFNDCGNPGLCGGVVLDETHVLTAAHCVAEFDKRHLRIIAGTNDLRSEHGIKRKIEEIYFPDDYPLSPLHGTFEYYQMKLLDWLLDIPKPLLENDLAVLKLDEALPLGERISSVQLPTSSALPYYEPIPLASFGDIARGTSTKVLKWANFHIIDRLDCYVRTGESPRHQFCIMHPKECSFLLPGDSGTPLVYNNTVIGVTSQSSLFANSPAVLTKVFDFVEFIKKSLDK